MIFTDHPCSNGGDLGALACRHRAQMFEIRRVVSDLDEMHMILRMKDVAALVN
jgi:hypothetical protein